MKNIFIWKILYLIIIITLPLCVSATSSFIIYEIRIEGPTHTKKSVLLTELGLELCSTVTSNEIQNAVQRIRNLDLFFNVNYKLLPLKNSIGHVFILSLEDNKTLTPLFNFGSASGASFYSLGIYDPSTSGDLLGLGATVQNFSNRYSVLTWFEQYHFLGDRRARLGGDLGQTSRNRYFYDDYRNINGGFTQNRQMSHVFYDYYVTDYFRPGVKLGIEDDKTSENGLSQHTKKGNKQVGRDVSAKETFFFLNNYATLGGQDFFDELVEGFSYSPSFKIQVNNSGVSTRRYMAFTHSFIASKIFPHRQNIAYRLEYGHSSRGALSQDVYLGGLDQIRGFNDSQFRVRNYAYQNFEYRYTWYKHPKFTLQQVCFHNTAWVESNARERIVNAAGTGFRFFLPRVYRLIIRSDFGVSLGPFAGQDFSLGLEQLF